MGLWTLAASWSGILRSYVLSCWRPPTSSCGLTLRCADGWHWFIWLKIPHSAPQTRVNYVSSSSAKLIPAQKPSSIMTTIVSLAYSLRKLWWHTHTAKRIDFPSLHSFLDDLYIQKNILTLKLLICYYPINIPAPADKIFCSSSRYSFYSLQRQVQEMNSLQSDFTKSLATADSSLLQTNIMLKLMEKSQEVETKLIL